MWSSIHRIALGYPIHASSADAAAYEAFFARLGDVLPCERCRRNYRVHIEHLPVRPFLVGGRAELFRWTVELHNLVNRSRGLPAWTVDQAMAVHGASRTAHPPPHRASIAVIVALYALLVLAVALALATPRRR